MYGKGISREGSLLDVAWISASSSKSGAWYTYEGEQLGQGRENAKAFLAENLELMIEVSEKIRQKAGLDGAADCRSARGSATTTRYSVQDSTAERRAPSAELAVGGGGRRPAAATSPSIRSPTPEGIGRAPCLVPLRRPRVPRGRTRWCPVSWTATPPTTHCAPRRYFIRHTSAAR